MNKLIRYIALFLLLISSIACEKNNYNDEKEENFYKVINVVDGDTIDVLIDNEVIRVRMIGIDTPESVHPNDEKNSEEGIVASSYTSSLLRDKSVRLEYDEDLYDDYSRLLAYVYLEDGTMVNLHLLEKGMAECMTIAPNDKYEMKFVFAENKAKKNKIGIWEDN